MEVAMSLNSTIRTPLSSSPSSSWKGDRGLLGDSLAAERRRLLPLQRHSRKGGLMVVEAKGKRGMMNRQFQRQQPPPLPKLEDDGNPKFVIFIREEAVNLWYPLSIITGGTTAKIMVSAKDNFMGKYIYKDTIARNIAAVIYRDEKEIKKSALKQFRVLRSASSFRYGYKLVENNNLRAALAPSNVVELPPQEELKTVVDKVKDFFGNAASGAKESFGKIATLNVAAGEESES